MPLKDELPKIDDRNYDDIVREIRARIPRYTPEWKPAWNDLNDNDPGVMLAQVFAWLSEMMLFRMGRVPELNYLKFLELIGIELEPAQPATTEITFVADKSLTEPYADVPPRAQVSAVGDDGKPVVFETLRSLRVLACGIKSVQTYDAAQYRDATEANEAAADAFLPFGELPREDGALALGFAFPNAHPNKDDFPSLTIELAFWTAAPVGENRLLACGPLTTRAYAPAKIAWEGWDGSRWTPLDVLNDETLAFTRSGHVWIRVPANVKLLRDFLGAHENGTDPKTGSPREPLFWLRARLAKNQYERPPRLLAVRINTVPAEQAQTVQGEILGGADGRRDQTWQLANTPVIRGSITIEIDDGTGAAIWEAKDDLFGSSRTDKHLAINYASGEVRAGDGENGDIPVANADNPDANIIAVEYRYGGGARGNVSAKKLTNLMTPVEGIDGGKTENLFAAAGGRDEERLDEAKKRARLSLRARERAVTPEDFELLAQAAGNVERAKALPLTHPQFPGVKVPGAVTVIVVPNSDTAAPTPSDGLLRTVCEYLDARRLLTTEVFVIAPRYITLQIDAQVVIDDNADPRAVREEVEAILADYFHPLTGGDDDAGWPFGGALRYSKIVQRVFSVSGVDSVPTLVLTVDGEEQPECRDVDLASIAPHALLNVTGVAVETRSRAEFEGAA